MKGTQMAQVPFGQWPAPLMVTLFWLESEQQEGYFLQQELLWSTAWERLWWHPHRSQTTITCCLWPSLQRSLHTWMHLVHLTKDVKVISWRVSFLVFMWTCKKVHTWWSLVSPSSSYMIPWVCYVKLDSSSILFFILYSLSNTATLMHVKVFQHIGAYTKLKL